MTLSEATRTCFRKYAVFSGRASRAEFWKFVLFVFLTLIVLVVVNSVFFGPEISTNISVEQDSSGAVSQTIGQRRLYSDGWLGDVFLLMTLLPLLSVTWRRMHDIGRAGWHLLLTFPLAAVIGFSVLWLAPTTAVPIDTSAFGAGYSGPTEIVVPMVPAWLLLSLWGLGVASLALSIFWLSRKSQSGPNRYGSNPLEAKP